MKEIIVAIASVLARFAKMIGSLFKVIFISLWYIFKQIGIKVGKTIKVISIFMWDIFLSYIYKFFVKMFRLIYLAFKFILLKTGIGIKIISVFLWQKLFNQIIKFIWYFIFVPIGFVFTKIYQGIAYVAFKLGFVIRHASLWIHSHIIVYVFKFFRRIYGGIAWLSNQVYLKLSIIAKWFWKYIVLKIIWFIKKIFSGIKWIAKKFVFILEYIFTRLFKALNYMANFIYRYLLVPVYRAFKICFRSLYRIVKYICIKIYKAIVWLLGSIKYLYYSMPSMIYKMIHLVIIYAVLILHFVFIECTKFIFYDLPIFIFKQLYQILKFIWSVLNKVSKIIGNFFGFIFNKLISIIEIIWLHLRDYLEFYYLVLLSPIIILVFVIMFVVATFILLFKFIAILIQSIWGKKVLEHNELIYVKPAYNPIKYLYYNLIAYNHNLKYQYSYATKIKSVWLLILIVSWQIIYLTLFFAVFSILLIPIYLLSLLFYKQTDISSRIVVVDNVSNGLILFKGLTVFGKSITCKLDEAYLIDAYTNQFIVHIEDGAMFRLNILSDGKHVSSKQFKVRLGLEYAYIKIFNQIKKQLLENTYYKFELPEAKHDRFTVKYETTWQRDKITDQSFEVRSIARSTDIKVVLLDNHNNLLFEQNVELTKLTNTTKLKKLSKKTIKLKQHESIIDYLPKKYDYEFVKTIYIDQTSKVLIDDDIAFMAEFYIKGYKDKHQLKIQTLATSSVLDRYMNELTHNFLDYDSASVNLLDITRSDGSKKEVTWYLNHVVLSDYENLSDIFDKVTSNPKVVLSVIFEFNGKYIQKIIRLNLNYEKKDYIKALFKLQLENHFEIANEDTFKLRVYQLQKLLHHKSYIKLPKIGIGKIICLRWISLDKRYVKHSGFILNPSKYKYRFKVILYLGLFRRATYYVEIEIKSNT